MSLWKVAAYYAEREGHAVIEDERGFATYCFPEDHECYIVDIYVDKEHRLSGVAASYADKISEIAKKKGCTILSGSVDSRLSSADDSIKVLQAYGMRLVEVQHHMIYFAKEI